MSRPKNGFSVMELLVVITIMALMIVLVASLGFKSSHQWNQRGFAREIAAIYFQVKAEAARENSVCCIVFNGKSIRAFRSNGAVPNPAWVTMKGYETVRQVPQGSVLTDIANADFESSPYTLVIDSRGFVYKGKSNDPTFKEPPTTLRVNLVAKYTSSANQTYQFVFYPAGGFDVQNIKTGM